MTVEDAVLLLDHHRRLNGLFSRHMGDAWADDFVRSVSGYVRGGSALSTEQSRISLKILGRARGFLVEHYGVADEIDALLRAPAHHRTPVPSVSVRREVRHLGDDLLGFRFKSNRAITLDIQNCAERAWLGSKRAWVHRDARVSVVPVSRDNVAPIADLIERHGFDMDQAAAALLLSYTEFRTPVVRRGEGGISVDPGGNDVVSWFLRDVLRAEAADAVFWMPADARSASRILDLAEVLPMAGIESLRDLSRSLPDDPVGSAAAKLVSCGLRGLLLADNVGPARKAAIAAVRAEGAFPAIVATRHASSWIRHLDGLSTTVHAQDREAKVLLVTPDHLVRQDVLARRRSGSLILDADDSRWIEAAFLTKGPAREVTRTIVIQETGPILGLADGWDEDAHRYLRQSLEILFGAEAVQILKQSAPNTQALRDRGFKRLRPADLYPLFGVISDLIGRQKPT